MSKTTDPADVAPAAGLPAVLSSVRHATREMGARRALGTLARLNQEGGFDCPGCAWPEPADPARMEFCENGAKHVAHEATNKRVGAEFFAHWPVSELEKQSDLWLEQQGRLVQPMIRRRGAEHYEPIAWDDAFARIGEVLRGLDSPDEAVFYTSGRTSNEAAFLYQLFARRFGTNNLPDCSNMCHESSGTGLIETIGVGKGTVSLVDFDYAEAIFLLGQNPGTNHPRMLTTLQQAKRRGAKIVSINPLRERGLVSFGHPQEIGGLLGRGTAISDLFLRVRVGGDIAVLQGIAKELLEREAAAPGSILDGAFIEEHTTGFDAYREALARVSWSDLVEQSGISRAEMQQAADIYAGARSVIACWAMGLTQHKFSVANVQEVVNLLLLRGNLGRAGAGACPVRGHSNVQGDRTMGITMKPLASFLQTLGAEFRFEPPVMHGYDTPAAIQAMSEGSAKVFIALGGNFAAATPDVDFTHAALRRCQLTVQISTKLNRSHLVAGEEAILLPCLGRTEVDVQESGPQFVTVEDSMALVHASEGRNPPASPELRSEPAIVAGIAAATLPDGGGISWSQFAANYDRIRDRIARVVPGFEDFNRRIRVPGGFSLPVAARERRFVTASGRAAFTVHPLPRIELAAGEYLMMTIRSHDQFNTTVYSLDDRYRGIRGDRCVVFMNADDIDAAGLVEGERVDIESHARGEILRVSDFKVVAYDLPRRTTATYYPEGNPLVSIDHLADKSRTPAYKSVVVRVVKKGSGVGGRGRVEGEA